jgi:hypothetical protein
MDPATFVTLRLPVGTHELRVHRGVYTSEPFPITVQSGQNFVRVLYRRVKHAPEMPLANVSCTTANQEGERMSPLKAKNIRVPMSQVIDSGAYFHPDCAQ